MEKLFVYGTLRPGGRAEEKMSAFRHLGKATVGGNLYSLGWYPGLVLGEEGEVTGDIYGVPESSFPALDDYEGCAAHSPKPHEYERVRADVKFEDGQSVTAWIYDYRAEVEPANLISSGDWLNQD